MVTVDNADGDDTDVTITPNATVGSTSRPQNQRRICWSPAIVHSTTLCRYWEGKREEIRRKKGKKKRKDRAVVGGSGKGDNEQVDELIV